MTVEKHYTITRIKVDLFLRRKQATNQGFQASLHGWISLQRKLADVILHEKFLQN